jgi:hypothetical protein
VGICLSGLVVLVVSDAALRRVPTSTLPPPPAPPAAVSPILLAQSRPRLSRGHHAEA